VMSDEPSPCSCQGSPSGGEEMTHRMKELVRSIMKKTCPSLLDRIVVLRRRRMFRKCFGELTQRVKRELYPESTPLTVKSGPFQGMRYHDEEVWGSIAPRWLGSVECELHSAVGQAIGRGYERVIDVGCSDGYYTVGVAVRIAGTSVYAFDMDHISRRQVARLARLNRVEDRVSCTAIVNTPTWTG
jgi:hypothetical protein